MISSYINRQQKSKLFITSLLCIYFFSEISFETMLVQYKEMKNILQCIDNLDQEKKKIIINFFSQVESFDEFDKGMLYKTNEGLRITKITKIIKYLKEYCSDNKCITPTTSKRKKNKQNTIKKLYEKLNITFLNHQIKIHFNSWESNLNQKENIKEIHLNNIVTADIQNMQEKIILIIKFMQKFLDFNLDKISLINVLLEFLHLSFQIKNWEKNKKQQRLIIQYLQESFQNLQSLKIPQGNQEKELKEFCHVYNRINHIYNKLQIKENLLNIEKIYDDFLEKINHEIEIINQNNFEKENQEKETNEILKNKDIYGKIDYVLIYLKNIDKRSQKIIINFFEKQPLFSQAEKKKIMSDLPRIQIENLRTFLRDYFYDAVSPNIKLEKINQISNFYTELNIKQLLINLNELKPELDSKRKQSATNINFKKKVTSKDIEKIRKQSKKILYFSQEIDLIYGLHIMEDFFSRHFNLEALMLGFNKINNGDKIVPSELFNMIEKEKETNINVHSKKYQIFFFSLSQISLKDVEDINYFENFKNFFQSEIKKTISTEQFWKLYNKIDYFNQMLCIKNWKEKKKKIFLNWRKQEIPRDINLMFVFLLLVAILSGIYVIIYISKKLKKKLLNKIDDDDLNKKKQEKILPKYNKCLIY
jgi:hypothetical protein